MTINAMQLPCSTGRTFLAGALLAAASTVSCQPNADARPATPSPVNQAANPFSRGVASPEPPDPARSRPAHTGGAEHAPQSPSVPAVSVRCQPAYGTSPLTVALEAHVVGDSSGLSFRWDFGDGGEAAFQAHAVHIYRKPGVYLATCTVRGPGGEMAHTAVVKVTPPALEVEIDVDPDIGYAPLIVQFAAVVDTPALDPLSFEWNFGDGSVDAGQRVAHVYAVAGQYTALLTVTSQQGQSVTRDVMIQVDPRDLQATD